MNDNSPKFEQPSYSCGLSVSAKRDQFVTILTASDADEVDQKHLRYAIVAGNEQQTFSMDPNTGIVTLTNLANFGDPKTHILNISVSDSVYTSFARLKIESLPANLHSPVFSDVLLDVQVPENQAAGYTVTTVKAVDKDFGEFGSITYSIHSDLLSESFAIDKNTGKIIAKVPLDREKQKLYEIPVMATDGGGRSGFLTVRVKVTDQNDNGPVFQLREYRANIYYNHSTSVSILKVKATDADEGAAAEIEYSIYDRKGSGINNIFTVNAKSGEVFLLQSVDSWGKSNYKLQLCVFSKINFRRASFPIFHTSYRWWDTRKTFGRTSKHINHGTKRLPTSIRKERRNIFPSRKLCSWYINNSPKINIKCVNII